MKTFTNPAVFFFAVLFLMACNTKEVQPTIVEAQNQIMAPVTGTILYELNTDSLMSSKATLEEKWNLLQAVLEANDSKYRAEIETYLEEQKALKDSFNAVRAKGEASAMDQFQATDSAGYRSYKDVFTTNNFERITDFENTTTSVGFAKYNAQMHMLSSECDTRIENAHAAFEAKCELLRPAYDSMQKKFVSSLFDVKAAYSLTKN